MNYSKYSNSPGVNPERALAHSPAVGKGLDLITAGLSSGKWKPGDRMPSLELLAGKAGISPSSMWKALKSAKSINLVTATRGGYILAGSLAQIGERAEAKVPQKALWLQKRRIIEQDLLRGAFGFPAKLPAMKELRSRYGICLRTLQKVMSALKADGVLEPDGKGYAATAVTSRAFRRRIVFITFQGYFAQESALSHENSRIVNLFESECLRMGLQLEIVEVDFYDSRDSHAALTRLRDSELTLGYILESWWNTTESFRRTYTDTLARLAAFKKPVVILDDAGSFDLPSPFIANPLIQVFCLEGARAGERMARLLLSLGHKQVAYISLLHYMLWSRDRFTGIAQQYARAGYPDAVNIFSLPAEIVEGVWPNMLTVSGLNDDDVRQLLPVGNSPSQVADLEKQWNDFKARNKPPYPGFHRLGRKARDYLTMLIALNRLRMDETFVDATYRGALNAMAGQFFRIPLVPLFEKALKNKTATAWICANDATAFEALTFLRSKGKKVPQDISVAGFDNIPVEALRNRLTTFDFNAIGFIHRMLNFILRPPRPQRPYRHSPIIVEGLILERGTTGKAKLRTYG